MPTLRDYRRRAADMLGPTYYSTLTGGGLASVDILRWPIASSSDQATRLEGYYIYLPDNLVADNKVRMVKPEGGYDPTIGRLLVDLNYSVTDTPVATDVVELHGTFPPDVINDLVNLALKKIPVVGLVTFVPSSSLITRVDLTAVAPWLTNPSQVLAVGLLKTGTLPANDDPFGSSFWGEPYSDGSALYLPSTSGFDTGSTYYVRAVMPSYNYCRPTAGTYGAQNGLALETDEALPPENLVACMARVRAWQEYAPVLEAAANLKIVQGLAEASLEAEREMAEYWTEPPRKVRAGLRAFGPRR